MFIFCIDDTLNIYAIQDTKFIYKSSHLMNVHTFLENINAKFFITLTTKPKYSLILLFSKHQNNILFPIL